MSEPNNSLDSLQIISVKETCRILNVSVATIYRWEKENKLPFPKIKVGPAKVGFRKSDVYDHVNDQVNDQVAAG